MKNLIVLGITLLELTVIGCTSHAPDETAPKRHKISQNIALPSGGVMEVWGLIDEAGQVVIDPQYYQIDPFRDGMAQVKLQDMRTIAYIDSDGKMLFTLPSEVKDVGPFSEGLALANVGGKREEIDGVGFHGGMWGYIDKTGSWAIQPQFEIKNKPRSMYDWEQLYYRYLLDTGMFKDGRAAVPVDGGWAFIDRSGKIVISGPYTYVEGFHAGHTRVINEHVERLSPNSTKQVITFDAVINTAGDIVWETDWSAFN